ncbi:DUF2712 domain-containing protein [Lactococcus allomyrinae]|nr:DUF2712 domain-containing protein [Lactococcus allomyrinae]
MKKTIACFVVGGVLLAGVTPVFANNHTDRAWGGTLPLLQANHYTNAYQKTDTSSGYIKLNTIGKGGINAYMQLYDGTSVNSPKVNLKAGQSKYVINYAYENYGQVNVRMAVESDYLNVVTIEAHGVWSPDSV